MKLPTIMKTSSALTLLAVSLFTSPLYAKAEFSGKHEIRALFKQLDLTEQQRQDARLVIEQNKPDFTADKTEMRQNHEQLTVLIQSDAFDEEAVAAIIGHQLEQSADKKWQRALLKQQLWQLLTAEQQQSWLQADDERQAKGQHNKKDGGHKNKGDKRNKGDSAKHMNKRLQLTDEQTAGLATLKQAQKEQAVQHHQSKQAFKKAELALISEGKLTEASWTELYAQYQPDMQSAAVAQAKFRQQMWQLLTPEQQQRFVKLQKKMHRKHQQ